MGDLRDAGNNVVLGMDANDDVRDGEVMKAMMVIGMYKAVVSNTVVKVFLLHVLPTSKGNQSTVSGPLLD